MAKTGDPQIDSKGAGIFPAAGGKQAAGCTDGTIEMPAVAVSVLMKPDRDADDEIGKCGKENKCLVISRQEVHFLRPVVCV